MKWKRIIDRTNTDIPIDTGMKDIRFITKHLHIYYTNNSDIKQGRRDLYDKATPLGYWYVTDKGLRDPYANTNGDDWK